MNKEKFYSVLIKVVTWICRIVFGITFIVSGWAKGIDPWGTFYKISEYFTSFNLSFNEEITFIAALALASFEFTLGICILFGCLRRTSSWFALGTMCVMLPLTIYIYWADPVSDCGCFGDFIVLSNSATMWKNVVLTVMAIILVKYNRRCPSIYSHPVQWIVIVISIFFILAVAFIGYSIQPAIDFRPYPIGTDMKSIFTDEDEDMTLVYEKNGLSREFNLEDLPDSTWTYIGVKETDPDEGNNTIVIFDGDDEVTESIWSIPGKLLILSVPTPDSDYLYLSRTANLLAKMIAADDGTMIGLIAADGDNLEKWKSYAMAEFEIFSVEDTSLKELVRGEPGVVYLEDGRIVWKRTLASVSAVLNANEIVYYDYDGVNDDIMHNHETDKLLKSIGDNSPYDSYTGVLWLYVILMGVLLFANVLIRIGISIYKRTVKAAEKIKIPISDGRLKKDRSSGNIDTEN